MMRTIGMIAVGGAGILGFWAGYLLEPAWSRRQETRREIAVS